MSGKVEFKTCCGCLKDADLSTMYYFVDPGVLDLYQECTNIYVEPDHNAPQQLCVLCYKQCEVWKYFKQQCEQSYTNVFDAMFSPISKKQCPATAAPASSQIPSRLEPDNPIEVKEEPIDIAFSCDLEQNHFFEEEDPEDTMDNSQEDEDSDELDDPMGEDVCLDHTAASSSAPKRGPRKFYDMSKIDPAAVLHLPEATRSKYLITYRNFMIWKEEQEAAEITEDLVLDYFKYLIIERNSRSPETLMSHLKSTLQLFNGVSFGGFRRLKAFVHQKSREVVPRKSPRLSPQQLMQFVKEASDEEYGTTKVVVALWLAGCTNSAAIYDMKRSNIFDRMNHMEVLGVGLIKARYIIQPSVADDYNPVPMIRHYLCQAKDNYPFLLRRGKQRTGINSIKAMPKAVAGFLKLQDRNDYNWLSVQPEKRRRRRNANDGRRI